MSGLVITVAQQKGGAGKTTLAVNLAVALLREGRSVALLDTDPQGSLGRWFMQRREALGEAGLEFSTSSAWGVSYECEKLRKQVDVVIIDTPPKVDSDLRPALREADLILVPVAASHVDLWATEGVLDLARREGKRPKIVLNRTKSKTRLGDQVRDAATQLEADLVEVTLGHRVVFAETLGQGLGVLEAPRKGAGHAEVTALLHALLNLE
ncbi:ParA family partition ATPase [Pseudothioclava nitratireducens]|jgi:chromosome partitioning protein|uniref:ParA family partition ATPase n=1 Tax=Pseudothioclava nitratireducens TaxID=1928646 RepID=UPI0023DBDE5D|nr:ParA family partition ATPase [Defluviimonas nitratireducens]MDF1621177.1 ParA family partition ATPase [Defluviimonas nitratireducens]